MKKALRMWKSATMTINELQRRVRDLNYLVVIGPLANQIPKNLSRPTILIDGGHQFKTSLGSHETISIGDGDSSSPENMDILLPEKKDISDLGFTLESLPLGIHFLELCGFFGHRLDHQLANFGCVHNWLSQQSAVVSFDEGRSGFAQSGGADHTMNHNGLFSVFSLLPNKIQISGEVEFPLITPTVIQPLSSHGLSNKASGSFQVHSELPIFILFSTNECQRSC